MPELPEVETIRRGLEKYVVGHTIEKIDIRYQKTFQGDPSDVVGSEIVNIRRYGKVLALNLSNKISLVIHVKMTGQLIYRGPNLPNPPILSKKAKEVPGKHTHVIFHLNKGGVLYFNDVRKFGWIKVIKTGEVEKENLVGKLGPEPFKDLTETVLSNILSKSKKPVKILIMDQEQVSGVGNIYANEALWLAKIHPMKAANTLTKEEVGNLYNALLKVLNEGIKFGGASETNYVAPDGSEGMFQQHFLVYGREGEICLSCKKEKISKIKAGGRGTYFCANCQK